jgi:hypothetical protein
MQIENIANPTERTLKERLGIALEKWLYVILKILFPASKGYRITHPDWNNYNNHHGVDFRVFHGKKEILAIECKNWRRLATRYGSDVALTEIIGRFKHVGTNLKICLISFIDVLTEPALASVKAQGIRFLNIGKLVGHKDFKSSLFYQIKSAIQKLLSTSASSVVASYSLVHYSSSECTTTKTKTIPTIENNKPEDHTDRFSGRERFPDRARFQTKERFSQHS